MKISVVTDEISADLESALELAAGWGLREFELRGYGERRVPNFSGFQKQRVCELLDEYSARVVAISPGLFKIPYPTKQRERFPLQAIDAVLYQKWHDARSLLDYHRQELLPASLAYAQEVGAQQVILFGFDRGSRPPGAAPDEVLESLHAAAGQAQAVGLSLAIEVEEGYWADTGRRSAALIGAVGHPALGINWDPGNALPAGEIPYPDGYQAAKEHVRHVHFKDLAQIEDGSFVYAVYGQIDWAGQLQALAAQGYRGYISVEPHMQPKVASAQACCLRLKALLETLPGKADNT